MIHLIEVGPRTEIEIPQTGLAETHEETRWQIDNDPREIKSEDKAVTSAALRVRVERVVSVALVMGAIRVRAEVSLTVVVSEPATAEISEIAEVLAIAEALGVVTELAIAA